MATSINYLELFCTLVALSTSMLTIKQKAIRWPIDTIIIVLTLYIHHQAHLYDRWILSGGIMLNNFYGWYQWLYGGKNKTPLRVSRISRQTLVILVSIGMIGSVILGIVLKRLHADFPYWGALRTSFTWIAIGMASKKKLENWIFWVFLNSIAIAIYYQKGLYFF